MQQIARKLSLGDLLAGILDRAIVVDDGQHQQQNEVLVELVDTVSCENTAENEQQQPESTDEQQRMQAQKRKQTRKHSLANQAILEDVGRELVLPERVVERLSEHEVLHGVGLLAREVVDHRKRSALLVHVSARLPTRKRHEHSTNNQSKSPQSPTGPFTLQGRDSHSRQYRARSECSTSAKSGYSSGSPTVQTSIRCSR